MIEDRARPGHHTVVTDLTVGGKTGGRMIGFGRLTVLLLVAGDTVAGLTGQHIVLMALETIHGLVYAFQPETRHTLMFPCRGIDCFPIEGGVAVPALDPQLQPVAVILFPVPVAGFTIHGGALHDAVQMAVGAGDRAVFAHQGKIGLIMGNGCPAAFLRRQFRRGVKKQVDEYRQEKSGKHDIPGFYCFFHVK